MWGLPLRRTQFRACLFTTLSFPFLMVLLGHYVNQFRRRRELFGFSGRKSHLTLYSLYFILVWMPTRIFSIWLEYYSVYENKHWWATLASTSNSFVRSTTFFGAILFLSLRVWLVFFDVNLAVANSDRQWISLISQPVGYCPAIAAPVSGNAAEPRPATRSASMAAATESDLEIGSDLSLGIGLANARKSADSPVLIPIPTTETTTTTMSLTSTRLEAHRSGTFSVGMKKPSVHRMTLESRSGDGEKVVVANWFYRNKTRYGNLNWLVWKSAALFVLYIVPAVIFSAFPSLYDLDEVWFLVWVSAFALLCLYVACGYPQYRDCLRVYEELKMLAGIGVIGVLFFVFFLSFRRWFNDNFWTKFYLQLILLLCVSSVTLVQTFWVIRLFDPYSQTRRRSKGQVQGGKSPLPTTLTATTPVSVASSSVASFAEEKTSTEQWTVSALLVLCCGEPLDVGIGAKGKGHSAMSSRSNLMSSDGISLHDILQDEEGFRLFMRHLFTEFSYECLLCVVELVQFREFVKSEEALDSNLDAIEEESDENEMDEEIDEGGIGGFQIAFAKSLSASSATPHFGSEVVLPPSVASLKSSIAWSHALSKEQKFVVLVRKYIADNAEMAVNISYGCRKYVVDRSDFLRGEGKFRRLRRTMAAVSSGGTEQSHGSSVQSHTRRLSLTLPSFGLSLKRSGSVLSAVRRNADTGEDAKDGGREVSTSTAMRLKREREEDEVWAKKYAIKASVFDNVIREMLRLMKDSLTRFRKTAEYPNLSNKLVATRKTLTSASSHSLDSGRSARTITSDLIPRFLSL